VIQGAAVVSGNTLWDHVTGTDTSTATMVHGGAKSCAFFARPVMERVGRREGDDLCRSEVESTLTLIGAGCYSRLAEEGDKVFFHSMITWEENLPENLMNHRPRRRRPVRRRRTKVVSTS
jgi:hypothetical protein